MAVMAQTDGVCDLKGEFIGGSLGDTRLDARLVRVVELMAESPSASFPEQMGNDAELEALYRFLGNKRVTLEKSRTLRRARRPPACSVRHHRETEADGEGTIQGRAREGRARTESRAAGRSSLATCPRSFPRASILTAKLDWEIWWSRASSRPICSIHHQNCPRRWDYKNPSPCTPLQSTESRLAMEPSKSCRTYFPASSNRYR
jgi:Transposase DNA-binding